MTAGQFEIAQLDGNLKVDLYSNASGCVGTTVNSSGKAIDLDAKTRLVDASVDLSANAWRLNAEGGNVGKYASLGGAGSTWLVKTLGSGDNLRNYYAAVSWKMTIRYDFASEKGDMGVYLDLANSSFTPTEVTGQTGTKGDSALGFRIMFISGSNKTIWGNNPAAITTALDVFDKTQTYSKDAEVIYDGLSYKCILAEGTTTANAEWNKDQWEQTFKSSLNLSSDTDLTYVSGNNATTPYTSANYVVSNSEYGRYSDGTGHTTEPERIATITKSGTSGTADVMCYAWFEGTDPNVVNDTIMKYVNASMTFYARCDATVDPAPSGD